MVETSKNTTATPIIDQNSKFPVQHLSGAEIFRNEHEVRKLAESASSDYIMRWGKLHIMRKQDLYLQANWSAKKLSPEIQAHLKKTNGNAEISWKLLIDHGSDLCSYA